MKDKILFVSDLCPDCAGILGEIEDGSEKYKDYDVVNITSSMPSLKLFLKYRDTLPGYEEVRKAHRAGVPSVVIGESEVEFL
ncbi:hypothetical protein [Anaerococcus degeneri]|uniref:Glutaredoxin n=1 Tax=Anaerococcus degeneri TaxID=361500 RepID=A0ABS7YYF8_9FIRM|nr:hypothetical protein [Anaerococcus degeneri]MBP2015761.1 glutaredoxin-related protein [Anaerococcus degeneri]MCA2096119.1 hypothetical protein [Anaerococcus degeneri]